MALVKKPLMQQWTVRRIWKTPGSKLNWLFLVFAVILLGCVYIVYRYAVATQPSPDPSTDPLRDFGIVAFGLVLVVAAYTLRRRFVRRLPGKVQNWLWLHIWFGVISVLIACMHENFQNITHDFSFTSDRFTESAYGTTALYALSLLVVTGIVGRLLDIWQARLIAAEADTNGVGIIRSVEDRLFDLSLAVDRLCAGKSVPFKQYCEAALQIVDALPPALPALVPAEVSDFQRVYAILSQRLLLARSLERQKRACLIIRMWRYIHISVACAATLIIFYHGIFELWSMLVLHQ
jgi:hypothetical protein